MSDGERGSARAPSRLRKLLGRLNLVVASVLALAVWLLLVVASTMPELKVLWDVSPQAQFSVTSETERLLDRIREAGETLELDTFYGLLGAARDAEQAHVVQIHRRIQELTTDLLKRYASLGGSSVVVTHYDLARDIEKTRTRLRELEGKSVQNSVLVKLGKRFRVLDLVADLAVVDVPGQASQVPGMQRALPVLRSYKGEEAISSAVRALLTEGTPRVYVLTGHRGPSLTEPIADSYSELLSALNGEGFEVALLELERDGKIPDDAAVVAALEPRSELSPRAVEAVYAYLRRGGRMLLNVGYEAFPESDNPTFPELGRLLGFRLGTDLVCHPVPDPNGVYREGISDVPEVQNIAVSDLGVHPITRPLIEQRRTPLLKTCREITAAAEPPDGVRIDTSLLRSGQWSWLARRRADGVDLRAPADRSAFAPRSVGAVIEVAAAAGGDPGELVLVSGRAFVNHGGFQHNGDLALNVFNWLARRDALVTVRGNRYRPEALRATMPQLERARDLLVFWVPGALVLLAVAVFVVRRRQ